MAQFLGDLAFLAELAVVAGGLTLLHRARAEAGDESMEHHPE